MFFLSDNMWDNKRAGRPFCFRQRKRKSMKISSVIVTYNRLSLLQEALKALEELDLPEDVFLENWIVDNASTDGTIRFLISEENRGKYHVIHSSVNLGGSGGFNLGMKAALKGAPDYIWLMDDDMKVYPDSLTALLKQVRLHPEGAFFSSKALWTDGTPNKINAQRLLENPHGKDCVRCREATFVSLLISVKAIRKVGFPIKDFFIWGDDIEYTRRMTAHFSGYYVPGSVVLHQTVQNCGSDIASDSSDRLGRYRFAYRNEMFIAKQEGAFRMARQLAKLLYHTVNVALKAPDLKKERIRMIWLSSKEGISFAPKIEYTSEHEKPVRVLEVFREPLANGGQEAFIMNMYRNIDRDSIQMDFLTPFTCDNPSLQKEVENYGGRVFCGGFRFGESDNAAFTTVLKQFLKEHSDYQIVHFHSGSIYALMKGPQIAAQAGVPVRIVHSHCTGLDNLKYRVVKTMSTGYFHKYTTAYAACSKLAAEWKFPEDVIRADQVTILKNAVDLDRFHYDPFLRQSLRERYGVEDDVILGHVGRFSAQKNHRYLLDVFERYHYRNHRSQLWLIGEGEEQKEIEAYVKELGLTRSVKFFGLREDIPDLMNAMDVLVLPSLFEGLPVVGVEAQACSLPVIASDHVTKELPLKDLCSYLPLGEESLDQWVNEVDKMASAVRKDHRAELTKEGYDVRQAARRLENYYLQLLEDR